MLNVNVVLMKELLKVRYNYESKIIFQDAEEKGFICRDDSMEGLRYYENLFFK